METETDGGPMASAMAAPRHYRLIMLGAFIYCLFANHWASD